MISGANGSTVIIVSNVLIILIMATLINPNLIRSPEAVRRIKSDSSSLASLDMEMIQADPAYQLALHMRKTTVIWTQKQRAFCPIKPSCTGKLPRQKRHE